MNIEQIAEVAHEANRRYCQILGTEDHREWSECTKEHQDRMMSGVRFNIVNPEITPQEQHENWMKMMSDKGWTYGPDGRNEEVKTHWCMVPYDQLPAKQQAKDALFRSIVMALLPVWDGNPEHQKSPS